MRHGNRERTETSAASARLGVLVLRAAKVDAAPWSVEALPRLLLLGWTAAEWAHRARSLKEALVNFASIWQRVRIDDAAGCWLWTGPLSDGYARAWIGGSDALLHRVVYGVLKAPIPDGLVIDHLCRQRNCLNPEHLEPVTNRENLVRGSTLAAANVKKTHCPYGHAYDNLRARPDGRFFRACKACERRRWHERSK